MTVRLGGRAIQLIAALGLLVGLAAGTTADAGADHDVKWISLDLGDQYLVAWEGGVPVYETAVSTGRAGFETPTGGYQIERKFAAQDEEPWLRQPAARGGGVAVRLGAGGHLARDLLLAGRGKTSPRRGAARRRPPPGTAMPATLAPRIRRTGQVTGAICVPPGDRQQRVAEESVSVCQHSHPVGVMRRF